MRNLPAVMLLAASLPACVSVPEGSAGRAPHSIDAPSASSAPRGAPATGGFIAPTVMNAPGLEKVIGRTRPRWPRFGAPRLEVREGDAVKLQFSGEPCVLDVFLYPLRPGAEPSATHVDARRASDGADVDRAACVRALSQVSEAKCVGSDHETLAAAAGALGIGVLEHEAGGEIVFDPVHRAADQIEHARAVDVEHAAGGVDLLVERASSLT